MGQESSSACTITSECSSKAPSPPETTKQQPWRWPISHGDKTQKAPLSPTCADSVASETPSMLSMNPMSLLWMPPKFKTESPLNGNSQHTHDASPMIKEVCVCVSIHRHMIRRRRIPVMILTFRLRNESQQWQHDYGGLPK